MSTIELLHEPIERLSKDLRDAVTTLTPTEIRYLVDLYYQIQDFRIAAAGQVRSMSKDGEPIALLSWAGDSMGIIERDIAKWMDIWTRTEPTGMGTWARGICGIGPVLSAGLLAHIDMTPWRCAHPDKAKKACTAAEPHGPECKRETLYTVGHIWRYAGLDPTQEWGKGEKRPWNASLKVLCWKIGESFVKVSGNDKDMYGKLYQQRKLYEQSRNDSGALAEQAAMMLKKKNFRKDTVTRKAYESGRLSDGHIHARAKRWAVKIFLSHWHAEACRRILKIEPPKPFAIAILGHAHEI